MATQTLTKKDFRKDFDGSDDLFNACWRKVGKYILEGHFDQPDEVLDQTAAELVNDPRSRFYIYG